MEQNEIKKKYSVVNLVDVNELLTFVKKEYRELDAQIKEEKRIEDELKDFIKEIEKHSGHSIHHIGHEKKYGAHLIRFLFKDGGFLEVIVEKPLAITGHFLDEKAAKKFAKGLKKTLNQILPDSPIKQMYIDSVNVEDGMNSEILTLDKWSRIHKIAIHKTIVITITAVFLFVLLEFIKELFIESAREILKLHSMFVSLTIALIIAISFEPIKIRVEKIVGKFID